jgi:hypothetical protein
MRYALLWLRGALLLGLIGFTAYELEATVGKIKRLVEIKRGSFLAFRADSVQGAPPQNIALTVYDKGRSTGSFRLQGDALLLVSKRNCGVCLHNMARWSDLIAEAQASNPRLPIYLLSTDGDSDLAAFYRPLLSRATLVKGLNFDELVQQLRISGYPSTVVVRKGKVFTSQAGFTGERRRSYLLANLGR